MPEHIKHAEEKIKASVYANPKYKKYSKARKEGIVYGILSKKMGIKMAKGGHLKQMRKK